MFNRLAQNKRRKGREDGIAIPEVMVIISLVVILAMLSYPKYYDSMTKASRDGALVATDAIIKALAMYQLDKRGYPPEGANLSALGDYTNITNLRQAYTVVTLVQSGQCVQGIVSGIGSVSQGEEYHVINCFGKSGLKPGGYCCMKPNSKTGTTDCNYTDITSYPLPAPKWYECKSKLF